MRPGPGPRAAPASLPSQLLQDKAKAGSGQDLFWGWTKG
ncbi:hypothetical protein Nmel_014325 [Mimus melanotis]